MPQNATRADFTRQIRKLHFYLGMIAGRPLEFNTVCRALAQEALSEIQLVEPEGAALVWRDPMDEKERDKILRRPVDLIGGKAILQPREGKGMDSKNRPQETAQAAPEAPKTEATTEPAEEVFMIEVESTNLARVGFHHGNVLRVQFHPKKDQVAGDMWDYKGITQSEFVDLVNDDSPGKTYIALTRNRGIVGTKVEGVR